jgi:hypothetical protein
MQPTYASIGQIFGVQTRYTVPLFQRPYVWSQDAQWDPLWDDVEALADRVMTPPAHKPIAGHFLGTVVLEQVEGPVLALPRRQVIDGQQRLTTLQVLLKAAQDVLSAVAEQVTVHDAATVYRAAGQLSQLTRNGFATDEECYKVWPTNDDRAPFAQVMDSAPDRPPHGNRLAEAYCFFREQAAAWLSGPNPVHRALALCSALKDHLRLIVLDLDKNDEPQAIFETLNAHGTPLLPADLTKNWLLWEAGKQQLDGAELYEANWRQFDADHEYWRKEIGTGHAARPRVDVFLQSWLTAATRESVAVKHLYDRFLGYATSRAHRQSAHRLDVTALMQELRRSADQYRQIDAPQGGTPLSRAFRRLARLEFVVFRPVLMALMDRGDDDLAMLISCRALESFLIRRMVCNLQTRGYGTLALDLLAAIATAPTGASAAPQLITALNGAPGSANEWPTDGKVAFEWSTRRFYKWFRRDRVLLVLQAIEEHYQERASKAEPILHFDFSRLTIEHVLPQQWQKTWPLPPEGDANRRDAALQGIGNLTLVSGKLNPSLSNAPWLADGHGKSKRQGLDAYSRLFLNRRLLDAFPDRWDEETIEARAKDLFQAARTIWPDAPILIADAQPSLPSRALL